MKPVVYQPIGIIHTPFTTTAGMPIQPRRAEGIPGRIEVFPEFSPGLQDLDGFSHIILIYHFDRAAAAKLRVVPFMDTMERGVFATRAPVRPNPIGLSIVRLRAVAGASLEIENVDILDGTPLLDLKPYVPDFDCFEATSIGWVGSSRWRMQGTRSDNRFQNR